MGVFRTYKPLVLPSNYSVGVYGFSKSVSAFTPHRKYRPQARTHRRRACGLEGKGGGGRGGWVGDRRRGDGTPGRLSSTKIFLNGVGGKLGGKVWPPAFPPTFPPSHFKIRPLKQYEFFLKRRGGKVGGKGLAAWLSPQLPPQAILKSGRLSMPGPPARAHSGATCVTLLACEPHHGEWTHHLSEVCSSFFRRCLRPTAHLRPP